MACRATYLPAYTLARPMALAELLIYRYTYIIESIDHYLPTIIILLPPP